ALCLRAQNYGERPRMYPTGQLDPAQPIRGKAIELNAPTLVFLVMPQFRARRECSDLPRGGWFSDFLLNKMRSLGYPNLGCSEQRRPMRLHPSSR
ncbi:MAG: hypothetical protein DMG70_33300, partial [Acidobacteria bacterium]